MQRSTAPPGEAWRLGSGPFVFSGRPPLLAGDVELVNTSEETVKVKAIETAAAGERALGLPRLGDLRLAARLAPGESARTRGHFLVDPHTPPGTYTTELEVAGQREQIVVHVFEDNSVELSPHRLELAGAAGETVSHLVVARNRGNLPHQVPEHGLVWLEERNWIGRSLVYALREAGKEENHDAYLDRLFRELRGTMARPAELRIEGDRAPFAPGDSREFQIHLPFPKELLKGRTYYGSAPFLGRARLAFQVFCTGAPNSTKRRPQ